MARENSSQAGATPTDPSARESEGTSRETPEPTPSRVANAEHAPLPPEVLRAKPPGDSMTKVLKGV